MPCTTPNVYTKVPDGGWGWTVAFAFFFVEALTYGIIKSFGVFFNDLMESFDETNSRISWIISICVFVQTFTGKSKGHGSEGAAVLLTRHARARSLGYLGLASLMAPRHVASIKPGGRVPETPQNGCLDLPGPLSHLSCSA